MPFIKEILKYKSLSIVGLAKNTGKTECLNYIIKRWKDFDKSLALTSIGIDGEGIDQVTLTHKPDIELYENMVFITSEKHYTQKLIDAEIIDVSSKRTALGRLVTARAKSYGKVLFSGPTNTVWLQQVIKNMSNANINTTIIDGALSRLSLASPAITDSMILATGAAVSTNLSTLLSQTEYVYELINLPVFESQLYDKLIDIDSGIWAIEDNNIVHNLNINSVFLLNDNIDKIFKYGSVIFVAGAITNRLLNYLRMQPNIKNIHIIIKDFTKVFADKTTFKSFISKGGKISTLHKTNLIAICINPTSPQGFKFDSIELKEKMINRLQLPVYDVKNL